MAKWERTLDLLPEWNELKSGNITPEEMGVIIAERLDALTSYDDVWIDEERLEIMDQFKSVDETTFNYCMEYLYNWADEKISGDFFDAVKTCWVRTF